MTKCALLVSLEAKPGKETEVAALLNAGVAFVNEEPATISWYAFRAGPSSFGIFDTFDSEAGRDAHLNGRLAAALMAKAGELLAKPPTIEKIDLIAQKP
jgi:quinol monooxygenase YgiN